MESLRAQTFRDFKVSIVDGGSTDATPEICAAYCRSDPRFRFSVRQGTTPPERFNETMAACETEYLAIAHSDDIQHPKRLERQVAHMNRHVDVVMSGTDTVFWLHDFHGGWATPYSGIAEYPRSHDEIVGQLPFWWCFANPTLIYRAPHFCRKELFADTRFRFSGDYLFYWRAARSGRVENLGEVLLAYRHHMQSEGPANRVELDEEGRAIRRTIAEESGLAEYLGPEMTDLLMGLKVERNAITGCPASLGQYGALLERIVTFAQSDPAFDAALMRSLADNYIEQLRAAKHILHKMPDGMKTVLRPFWRTAKRICRRP